MMENIITKSHIPILEFAFLKMVYATSVYSAIEKGKIKPDYLDLPNGERLTLIDLRKYGNYKFRVHNPDKTALIKWFISVDYKIKSEKLKRRLMGRYGLSRKDLMKQTPNFKTKGYKSQAFTEWCYNLIEEHNKSYQFKEAEIYVEVLQKHLECNLNSSHLKFFRNQAKSLLNAINEAITNVNLYLPPVIDGDKIDKKSKKKISITKKKK